MGSEAYLVTQDGVIKGGHIFHTGDTSN